MEPPSPEFLSIVLAFDFGEHYMVLLQLLLMIVLLTCSALISGSEVAYFSLNPADLEELNASKDKTSTRVLNLLDRPNRLLATILIVNNLVNVAIIILSNYLIAALPLEGFSTQVQFLIQVVAVTFLILLMGEVIPKVYATKYRVKLARFMAGILVVLRSSFSWLSSPLISSTNVIRRRLPKDSSNLSVDELEHALELTNDENTSEEEQKILKGIVRFGNTDVKQIMTPRTDIISAEVETDFASLIDLIIDSGYSRIPVYQESFDKVVGILYVKDLLAHLDGPKDMDWQALIRTPFFVPENKKIDDLLQEFREKKIHLAVVVDEYGGTSGIVTLEDILEEIVGEITDEFDDDDLEYSKIDDNNYVFEGKIPLNDLYRVLDIDGEEFEAAKGESDTLAGFILELSGKIPLKNEKTNFNDFVFTIEAADRRRIKQVKVTIKKELATEEGKRNA